ncbi:hypothetical protein [Sinorhizobium meliloti]|uniref:hypothetical protein n=1 Tax=Rhizobium meliloti TaxID=382 RepID=UPI000FDB25D8|nr:hypothetical protein [Sinorhizobium meliloti]RVG50552.1 hypothetical protein CN226_21575 [Sinorhizobium meliloti]
MKPEQKLQDEFRRLIDGLRDASELSGDSRSIATASLGAVASFLRAFEEVSPKLRAPFLALIGALEDADEGIANELLKPKKMDLSKSRKPATDIEHKAALAVAVTILKEEAGWKLNDAVKFAAKAAEIEWKSLLTFRKDIGARRAPKDAIDRYHQMRQDARKYPNQSPEERGKMIIDHVRSLRLKKVD